VKTALRSVATAIAGFAVSSTSVLAAPLPIRINVIVHNDVPATLRPRLEADYLQPWIKEMETQFARRVEVTLRENVAGVSDLDYRALTGDETIRTVRKHNQAYWQSLNYTHWNYRLNKSLLLVNGTRKSYEDDGSEQLGLAQIKGTAGWASLTSFNAVGHELGHMFGASHEDAAILFNGWFCQTFTYPYRSVARSNCYRYSDTNRQAIQAYLSEAP
jgi:hypothetical protein